MGAAGLQIRGLSVGYHGTPVLTGIDLHVGRGQLLAVLGPNGCGKSTLVRALSGVIAPLAGAVTLDGRDLLGLRAAARARQVAVVPQAVRLPGAFTAAELVMMGRAPHLPRWGGARNVDRDAVWQAMCLTGVDTVANRPVEELSGGEQQRVVIARALAQCPAVLLLDEATAHLDLKHQVRTLELVLSLARQAGIAVLATLHELNQAAQFADRVAVLAAGALRAVGAPAAVFTEAVLSDVYGLPVRVVDHPFQPVPLVLADRAGNR